MPRASTYASPRRLHRFTRTLLAVCVLALLAWPVDAAEARIVILTEANPAYDAAVTGSLGPLRGQKVQKVILDRKAPQETAEAIAKHNPSIIMTVGSSSTKLALKAFPDVPVVFAMVLNPMRSGILAELDSPGERVTGAVMDIPFELQFAKFREIMPGVQRLGVLSNPEDTGELVEAARAAAERMGITLFVEPVAKSSEVGSALRRLLQKDIDGLWTVADRTVVSKSTSQVILRETARARIPTMGLSARHCRAGFLFALDVDFGENGRQAGELVVKIAEGAAPNSVNIAKPNQVRMAVNTRIAEFIGHEIPAGVIRDAADVYR